METFWHDVRYSIRSLARSPGFTLVAVLALALGIGANTAMFSVAYGLMLRPLPGAANAHELVSVTLLEPGDDFPHGFPHKLSHVSYQDYRSLNTIFADAVGFFDVFAQLGSEGGNPERIQSLVVTGNYFDVLGVQAQEGRTFSADESTRTGAGNVLVLSHEYWQRRFGGDPSAIGSVVRQGLLKAAIGIALGLLGAFGAARLLTNYLVGVTPTDPATFAVVVLFLGGMAVLASLVPALRATRVDPMIALRNE
ncbi:MAG: FtsX-like permease family protein [Luteitalea sp.]|nr:FtsX-like permease family protein [Luteitalea sp.]